MEVKTCHVFTSVLVSLLFMSNIQESLAGTTIKTSTKTYSNYLKTACNSTTFPKLCYNSLCRYASSIQTDDLKLCNTAITVTIKAANNASSMVAGLSKQNGLSKIETAVLKDCLSEIGDSIDELKDSLKALASLRGSNDVAFQISNMKTWISAAITDENTCTDGFDGTKVRTAVKNKIRKIILNLSRMTSNTLALVNNLNY